ncbi:MAG: hypothetical protein ABI691_13885 [Ginsengibacter sp.]
MWSLLVESLILSGFLLLQVMQVLESFAGRILVTKCPVKDSGQKERQHTIFQ